jgi:adenosylmethionine-8-amino-7-oxononanoate aminotransferase
MITRSTLFFPGASKKEQILSPLKYGEGVYLYDYDGKRYIDFSSGLMNVNIGHGDQRITAAVVKANAGGKLCHSKLRDEGRVENWEKTC